MAKTLDQIWQELDASYSPQRQALQARLDALPGQAESEIAGLKAQQTQAFDDIRGQAQDRGVFFSGVPIAEQAKYTGTQFLPAVARVKQSQNDVRQSLFDALNNVGLDQRKTAMGIYQQELQREEDARQFNESLAEDQRKSGSTSDTSSTTLPNQSNQGQAQAAESTSKSVKISPQTQNLYNSVRGMLNTNDKNRILREFNAIATSAGYGNKNDTEKLRILYSLRPELFNGRNNALKLAGVI